jgi:uncharacterized protein (TIGR00106 family)
MLAEFSIYPLDGLHLSKDVAKAIEVLENTGLKWQLGPMGTSVEGEPEQVFNAIQRCHLALAKDHGRVVTTVVIDDRKTQAHHLSEMVPSVEKQLGQRLPGK